MVTRDPRHCAAAGGHATQRRDLKRTGRLRLESSVARRRGRAAPAPWPKTQHINTANQQYHGGKTKTADVLVPRNAGVGTEAGDVLCARPASPNPSVAPIQQSSGCPPRLTPKPSQNSEEAPPNAQALPHALRASKQSHACHSRTRVGLLWALWCPLRRSSGPLHFGASLARPPNTTHPQGGARLRIHPLAPRRAHTSK